MQFQLVIGKKCQIKWKIQDGMDKWAEEVKITGTGSLVKVNCIRLDTGEVLIGWVKKLWN